ncbi:HD-GYP domain-containing protein [Kangiella sediminilitoris]|uniref:Metal dependent phosphohydrolase n=1 Tax=Kangiella sediminilitoris TaxID=1144748 RepID=A0A1B3BAG0_9GAMM|nr:HD-GYP domain-containing protein [Kangiella sediminilitoris]AOE49773.1 Metal dependent phosphohydrolase [Kangiella sediminilitoris]
MALIKAKIPADCIDIGMFVVELDRPWTDVPLAFQKFEVSSEHELKVLREYCKYVYIEIDAFLWEKKKQELNKQAGGPTLPENTPIHHELPRAASTFESARELAIELFESAKLGLKVDIKVCKQVVNSCITSILSNANALFWLTRIKDRNQFTAEHGLRVSILSIAFGKYLGMKREDLELLGLCGLLHDLGQSQIPQDIVDKKGPLNEAEYRVMQKHSMLGYELIMHDKDIDPEVKDVIKNHHVHFNGKGYPKDSLHLPLSQNCRIVSIIDVYDIVTSETPYKLSRSPREALTILFEQRDKQFDGKLVGKFIQMMGIYPPGSLVRMSNGEVGIVISTDSKHKLQPKVELVQNKKGALKRSIIIDLKKSPKDHLGEEYKISASLPDGALGFDMRQYIQSTHNC